MALVEWLNLNLQRLEDCIVHSEINLANISQLKKYKKIVVTGPHRSGTTISAKIIAEILKYRFVNEFEYDGNDPHKFIGFLMTTENLVIQNTSFLRDMHLVDVCKVLVVRKNKDILKSYKNSLKFGNESKGNIFSSINEKAKEAILTHFGHKSGCIPDILYNHFKEKNNNYYTIKYSSLRGHHLFIDKQTRRKEFKHIKQTEVSWNNS